MAEQDGTQAPALQPAITDDRSVWKAYWEAQGQSWRTEPEIDGERQHYLDGCRDTSPDIRQGIYPFKNISLSRADVEWLLATHEGGRGPVDWSDESQRARKGLDLRGADLSHVDLQNLPLACLIGDVTWREWPDLTEGQHIMARVLLKGADLKGAHLEGVNLEYADLEKADLRYTHLERANLGATNMEGAYLEGANLEGADLLLAHLDGAFLWRVRLAEATLKEVHLEGAHLDGLVLVNEQGIGPLLADVRWSDANLSVVKWSQIYMLGEEDVARQEMRDGQLKDSDTRLREYEDAVRANRQLAVALRTQGLDEDAAHFAYRAQQLQRIVLRRRQQLGQYFFSGFLDLLAGYGYQPGRSLVAYLLVISVFAATYALLGQTISPHLSPLGAFVLSVTAFHGRGFFPGGIPLDHPLTVLAALEAVMGLIIEISFIATFTQRFFGK